MKIFGARAKADKYRSFGDQARNEKRWNDAVKYYGSYINIYPTDDAILVQYGHALKETGKLYEAERAYNRAIEANPREADTYVQLGHVYKLTNRWDLAMGAYREALKRDGGLESALVELRDRDERAVANPEFQAVELAATAGQGLDHRLEPLLRHVTSLLDQLSTVKAISFGVVRARADIERIDAEHRTTREQINALAAAAVQEMDHRLEPLLRQVTSLLDQLSTVKGISFEVVRARADIERIDAEHRAAREQIGALEERIAVHLGRLDVETQARMGEIENRVAELVGRRDMEMQAQMGKIECQVTELIGRSEWCKPELRALSTGLRQMIDQGVERDDRLTAALGEVDARFGEVDRRVEASQKSSGAVSSRLDQLSVHVHEVSETMRRPDAARQDIQERIEFLEQRARQPAPAEMPPEVGQMLQYLTGRIEFVRREMMYEFQHSAKSVDAVRGATELQPTIKHESKVEAARGTGIRLNLGCGHILLDGYLNVDRRDLPGIDIIAEADALPFGLGEVSAIHSSHLLEHFPEEAMRRSVLPYWFGLLEAGGRLTAILPDGAAMLAHAGAGDYKFEEFREVLFGAQDYIGDYHYALYTPASLSALLWGAGFRSIHVVAEGRRNGLCYEFEIAADKPRDALSEGEMPS